MAKGKETSYYILHLFQNVSIFWKINYLSKNGYIRNGKSYHLKKHYKYIWIRKFWSVFYICCRWCSCFREVWEQLVYSRTTKSSHDLLFLSSEIHDVKINFKSLQGVRLFSTLLRVFTTDLPILSNSCKTHLPASKQAHLNWYLLMTING
jgi:hypothetical protein